MCHSGLVEEGGYEGNTVNAAGILYCTPKKNYKMTMDKQQFEDVSPIKKGDFHCHVSIIVHHLLSIHYLPWIGLCYGLVRP